ncbi:RuBisCO large subunit C-terminal-like domain-containing protein [Ramlibacter sp. 2FC]|uniref:RuBisCO large subunit C-terminal-like domain-containing protein n=1 Tax=Ramlibacter sp. 2FC TaxID=2502188 RepID=UPI0032E48F8D
MVSINWVGFPAVQHLRESSELTIHAHRNGWGALSRHPGLGMGFPAYQKLWRLAGMFLMPQGFACLVRSALQRLRRRRPLQGD